MGKQCKKNAGVVCVIVGVAKKNNSKKKIYNGNKCEIVNNINPYLQSGDKPIVEAQRVNISGLQKIEYGNMPLDGGYLKLDEVEKNEILNQLPEANILIRPLIGSAEFIKGINRYCLWIEDEYLGIAMKSPIIKERILKCKDFRQHGGDVAKTLVNRPHQFRYRKTAQKQLVIIPKVSSERRKYIPIGFLNKP